MEVLISPLHGTDSPVPVEAQYGLHLILTQLKVKHLHGEDGGEPSATARVQDRNPQLVTWMFSWIRFGVTDFGITITFLCTRKRSSTWRDDDTMADTSANWSFNKPVLGFLPAQGIFCASQR